MPYSVPLLLWIKCPFSNCRQAVHEVIQKDVLLRFDKTLLVADPLCFTSKKSRGCGHKQKHNIWAGAIAISSLMLWNWFRWITWSNYGLALQISCSDASSFRLMNQFDLVLMPSMIEWYFVEVEITEL